MFQAGAEVSLSPTASQRAQKTQPSQGGRAMDDRDLPVEAKKNW